MRDLSDNSKKMACQLSLRRRRERFIHEKYLGELLKSVFLLETRTRLLEIVDRMRERANIDGLILAGTELPLVLRSDEHNGVPLLDTTKIHVDRIVERLLS